METNGAMRGGGMHGDFAFASSFGVVPKTLEGGDEMEGGVTGFPFPLLICKSIM
jgi:hypothetical protein